jgi:hypothetical protein
MGQGLLVHSAGGARPLGDHEGGSLVGERLPDPLRDEGHYRMSKRQRPNQDIHQHLRSANTWVGVGSGPANVSQTLSSLYQNGNGDIGTGV